MGKFLGNLSLYIYFIVFITLSHQPCLTSQNDSSKRQGIKEELDYPPSFTPNWMVSWGWRTFSKSYLNSVVFLISLRKIIHHTCSSILPLWKVSNLDSSDTSRRLHRSKWTRWRNRQMELLPMFQMYFRTNLVSRVHKEADKVKIYLTSHNEDMERVRKSVAISCVYCVFTTLPMCSLHELCNERLEIVASTIWCICIMRHWAFTSQCWDWDWDAESILCWIPILSYGIMFSMVNIFYYERELTSVYQMTKNYLTKS